MASRPIRTMMIQFGMVSIPATVHTAVKASESKVSLNRLHRKCRKKLSQVNVCNNEGGEPIPVPKDDVVMGFEYSKGEYVVITDKDLASLPVASKGTIQIDSFVGVDELDPLLFETSYLLEPGKGGDRPFALLARALESDSLLAIAKVAMSKKEQLCALRVAHGRLFLHTLYYQSELQFDGDGVLAEVSAQELGMAKMLTQALRRPYDGEEYSDPYFEAFQELIAKKVANPNAPVEEPVEAEPEVPSGLDFMAKLEASIAAAKARPVELNKTTAKRPAAGKVEPKGKEAKKAPRRRATA